MKLFSIFTENSLDEAIIFAIHFILRFVRFSAGRYPHF